VQGKMQGFQFIVLCMEYPTTRVLKPNCYGVGQNDVIGFLLQTYSQKGSIFKHILQGVDFVKKIM